MQMLVDLFNNILGTVWDVLPIAVIIFGFQFILTFASEETPAQIIAMASQAMGPDMEPESVRWNGLAGSMVHGPAADELWGTVHMVHVGSNLILLAGATGLEEAKARMEQLVANLVKAFEQSIDELTWMTDATKQRAQEKLSKFTVKIGYPNVWKDYSALEIDPLDLVGNVRRSAMTEHKRMIDKLGKPIDREEWGMTPQTVNAYYMPPKNEIVFPAAILQPPFFNMSADDAVNYGGIGAVIGHEISHGFDDQGSKYDGDGNLKSWWTPIDRQAFEAITKRLVDQFSEYSPLPGKYVDGKLTLGENIADLSGLAIAHKAYRLSLDGKEPPVIDGWTGDQRFFLGWSQAWRRKYRDAEMMRRLLTDPHAPSWYRANGPVINIDAFYDAFDVQPEDALYRPKEERIKLW